MKIEINDKYLKGFNHKAITELDKCTNEFIDDMIKESNRIESSRNTTGKEPEITSSMVHDADTLIRRGLVPQRKGNGIRVVRVFAAVLSILSGALYDSTMLQDGRYMFFYILVITLTILLVTITIIKD